MPHWAEELGGCTRVQGGLSWKVWVGPNCNPKGPDEMEAGRPETGRQGGHQATAPVVGGRGHVPLSAAPPEAGKGQERILPPSLQGSQPRGCPDFSPVRPTLDSPLPDCKGC